MTDILYAILALFGIGILVFIHELGHYFVARRVGMTVEAFSIGFGKAIWKKQIDGVQWQLGWIPFGGFVRIKGMEKKEKVDPYSVPDGYYGRPPIDRIKVALAGPCANIVFALLAFSLLWVFGGRQKPFSEFTHIIGWVSPASPLYEKGVRPGDQISEIDGRPFSGLRDLILTAAMHDKEEVLSGNIVDYQDKKKTPFSYTLSLFQEEPSSVLGVIPTFSAASYLLYSPLPSGVSLLAAPSPMVQSGIELGDRVLWADGELIFSNEQLSYRLNRKTALLTVQRGEEILLASVPRLPLDEIRMSAAESAEVLDAGVDLDKRLEKLLYIPYLVGQDLFVQDSLVYVDNRGQETIYKGSPRTMSERPLLPGDQILAVDGIPVSSTAALTGVLQDKRIQMVVKSKADSPVVSWKAADQEFVDALPWKELAELTSSIGIPGKAQKIGSLRLLNPIAPIPLSELYGKKLEHDRLALGVLLQDEKVIYNPSPFTLFGDCVDEMYRTLGGLFTGSLSASVMSGPVGIVQVIHHSFAIGIAEAIYFLGFLSLNLALLNLLPIPVLDGGHICFALYEKIFKRKISMKWMERVIFPFFILLIVLFLFLTYQDIGRIVKGLFH